MSIFQVYSHVSWEEKEWSAERDTSVWLVLKVWLWVPSLLSPRALANPILSLRFHKAWKWDQNKTNIDKKEPDTTKSFPSSRFVQVNIWKIISLNCRERYESILHHLWVYNKLKMGWSPSRLDTYSSIGRALNRYHRGHGFRSRRSLNIFRH